MGEQREKPVGLRDIARAAGVSVSTVSMALANHPHVNDDTKRRIRALAREMNYRRPRRNNSHAREKKVADSARRFGFMLLGSPLQDETHLGHLHALTVAATAQNARLEIQTFDTIDEHRDAIEQTLTFASSLDGLVVTGMISARLLEELEATAVPHVIFGHAMDPQPSNWGRYGQVVAADAQRMGEQAANYLLDQGCRRIAFVCERMPQGLWAHRWHRGYRLALLEARRDCDSNLTFITNQPLAGGGAVADQIAKLADDRKPDGYIVPDTRVAGTLMMALRERDLAPDNQHIVTSGQPALLSRYGLSNAPWIGYNLENIATATVRQLQNICEEPLPCAMELIVPSETLNMPA